VPEIRQDTQLQTVMSEVEEKSAESMPERDSIDSEQSGSDVAADCIDFKAPLRGPSDMKELLSMMQQRGIVNEENLVFDEDFVSQFYDDDNQTQGVERMFNGEPRVWGDIFWTMIHLLTYYYPENPSTDVKQAAYQWVQSLRFLLPCENCRRGYRRELLETPVEEFLDSRETFIEWGIELHTSVNKRLNQAPFDTDATFKRILTKEKRAQKQRANEVAGGKLKTARSVDTTHAKHSRVSSAPVRVNRSSLQTTGRGKHNVESRVDQQKTSSQQFAPKRTTYNPPGRQNATAAQSLQSVRDALKRGSKLSQQQRANVLKNKRAQEARSVKKPAECKSCGSSSRPVKPSSF